jgi:hypothetical protein
MGVEERGQRYSGLTGAARHEHHSAVRHADRDGPSHHITGHISEGSVVAAAERSTEIELEVGAVALYCGRLATITRIGPNGRIVWVECTDEGGRTRTFSVFAANDLVLLPTGEFEVLDSIVKVTAPPEDELLQLIMKAELWFADPQVGDIFYRPEAYYYLRVVELTAAGELRAQVSTCEGIDEGYRTEQVYFRSIELFRSTFEFKTCPGYSLAAYSSMRDGELCYIPMPGFIGEGK